ncbi:uncharacterized protein LOC135390007 [Ornithodoros turicata]|uniref:uncharacterized protein LOC135390007 n=1 Tax=Ornithodoros turicata TaxID=34597 RepID=UPI00313A2740
MAANLLPPDRIIQSPRGIDVSTCLSWVHAIAPPVDYNGVCNLEDLRLFYFLEGLLQEFVARHASINGNTKMTFNIHQLLHLTKCAEALGPLWAHSAFVFEGGNGVLLKYVTAAKGAPNQVLERVAMLQELDLILSCVTLSPRVGRICENMLGYKRIQSATQLDEASLLGRPKHVTNLTRVEKSALQQVCTACPQSGLEYYRIVVKDIVLHSQNYSKPCKSDSSVIVTKQNEFLQIRRILQVSDSGHPKCVLLCKNILVRDTPEVARFPSYLKECCVSPQETLRAIPISEVYSVCLFISFPREEKAYVCTLPNRIEKD